MAILTPTIAIGKTIFTGAAALRAKDDASDPKLGGVYAHSALDFSATEAAEWLSFFMFLMDLLQSGGPALKVYNGSGGNLAAATPVKIAGYDTTSGALKIAAADAATGTAQYVLRDAINNGAAGFAYKGGAIVTALNTSGSAVGNPVYLANGGGLSLTPGTNSQVVGFVATLSATGTVVFHVAN